MSDDEQTRYRELLDQLDAVARRAARLEEDQRVIVELMQDFRELLRLLAARIRGLDGEIDRLRAWLVPVPERSERIARHLRN